MATNTYVALATQTVGTAVASYTFTNIPTASSSRQANSNGFNVYHVAGQSDANIKNNVILHYQNYSNTTTNKTILCRGNSDLETAATVALWRSTSAINTILVGTTSGNLVAGTTISIYGIKAQVTPGTAKATGGTITYDSYGNVIHTFTGNGTFTPTQNLTVDYLVIGGGGAGGSYAGGGGGAGGVRCTVSATGGGALPETPLSVTASTAYTVTIGNGGAAVNNAGTIGKVGTTGGSTTFGPITAVGGGGGGGYPSANATSGGSGGGGWAGSYGGTTAVGGSGTANQGYAGGSSNAQAGSGGGGAGSVGGTASGTTGGNGGSGISVPISGSWSSYAGGGGGSGTGGGTATAGGGNAANNGSTPGGSGTANTGGGGGGVRDVSDTGAVTSGAGGSGIVIIRYSGV